MRQVTLALFSVPVQWNTHSLSATRKLAPNRHHTATRSGRGLRAGERRGVSSAAAGGGRQRVANQLRTASRNGVVGRPMSWLS